VREFSSYEKETDRPGIIIIIICQRGASAVRHPVHFSTDTIVVSTRGPELTYCQGASSFNHMLILCLFVRKGGGLF
jgi:hypothetical protein